MPLTLINESLRLAALYRFGILDTPPEPQFDRLVALAGRCFGVPIAMVSFIDEDRQWLKAGLGVELGSSARSESFCSVTIAQDGVMVAPDTALDARLRLLPAVPADPALRFYAGAPILAPDGQKLGTFCVLDYQPRQFSSQDVQMLEAFAAMAMDELRLRQAIKELGHLALNDPLTGLPNRTSFQQHLIQACHRADQSGEKVALGLLDLDHFKLVNDTLGHAAGDELLQLVAQRLRDHTATGDLVARMGGDEFMLLLTGVRAAGDARVVVKRLRASFRLPFNVGGQEVFVDWSSGLSVYPDDTLDPEALLGLADIAMYRAKQDNGGPAFFNAQQDQQSPNPPAEMELITALHYALDRDELRLHFQPVISVQSGQVVAHEALLRWARPTGLVSPLAFIPAAEASGLIVPIGRWVLRQAMEAVRRGQIEQVTVNVSALEFQHLDFVPNLRQMLTETSIPPNRLILELTESLLLRPGEFGPVLEELRTLGVQTALDDFGTGYSSLTALSSLPIQYLKIDRSFVAPIGSGSPASEQALEIIRGIVTLASAYGLTTVAEGVETQQQAELLGEAGCSYLQGFYFGRPAPLT